MEGTLENANPMYGTYVTFSVWSSLDLFDWILDDDRKDRVAVAL